jgi:transcriptional regulator with XRE-family HTH domain
MSSDDFAARLRVALDEQGWTSYRLAKESHVSQQYVGQLLKGQRGSGVSADIAGRLADALEVRVEWLVHGTGSKDASPPTRLRDRREWPTVVKSGPGSVSPRLLKVTHPFRAVLPT